MKVQQIKQSIALQGLGDWGTAGPVGTPEIRVSGMRKIIPGSEGIDEGIFECTPGTYRRSVGQA
ncbi:putative cupin superfamily protein [Paraburkholderia atlantica]|uniref:Putative cupin superfamily protein n=1 Tax=Paraburkholderia atlantica TaxID=2654982 RepID=A0A7W8Q5K7_PARAM|nr:putative cupin superfamily protein [Paraburkholderia atlantica]